MADAHHPSAPERSGRWKAEVLRQAIADAGLRPEDIDAVIAHASSTPKGDTAEIRAINAVYVTERTASPPPVVSLKGHIGHPGAAAGAMGLITSVLGMADGTLPHTAGTRYLDAEIDFDVILDRPRSAGLAHRRDQRSRLRWAERFADRATHLSRSIAFTRPTEGA
ncbi:hypothetical protein ABZ599_40130 [Streptomyces misionensis]|uniref:hypothetical protein n=1 Tax=Streptomyces misionensis TaxID=67331 RepID=UPI0033C0826C